jgi:hypothetical protein
MSDARGDVPATAPGWYPHPDDAGLLRWWSGSRWTDDVTVQAPAHPPLDAASTAASPARRWGTPWVWFVAVSPILTVVTGLFALKAVITVDTPPWHWVVLLVVPQALVVGAAALDARQLRRWHPHVATSAWSLLGAPAYLIARTLAFRRQGRFGSAPMWVGLGSVAAAVLMLIGLAGFVLWLIAALSESMSSS